MRRGGWGRESSTAPSGVLARTLGARRLDPSHTAPTRLKQPSRSCLRLESKFLMLGLGRFGVALEGGFIADATDGLEDHAEAAAVAGR